MPHPRSLFQTHLALKKLFNLVNVAHISLCQTFLVLAESHSSSNKDLSLFEVNLTRFLSRSFRASQKCVSSAEYCSNLILRAALFVSRRFKNRNCKRSHTNSLAEMCLCLSRCYNNRLSDPHSALVQNRFLYCVSSGKMLSAACLKNV